MNDIFKQWMLNEELIPMQIHITTNDNTRQLGEEDILENERLMNKKSGIITDRILWSSGYGSKIELRIKYMQSFVVKQMHSIEFEVECIDFDGELDLYFLPVECMCENIYHIRKLWIDEINKDNHGIFVDLEKSNQNSIGIAVVDGVHFQMGDENEGNMYIRVVRKVGHKDIIRLQQLFVIIDCKEETNPKGRAKMIMSTVQMLPLEYWYQQQKIYLEQNKRTK